MHTHTDTICAISTPPGIGGIAVARVAGSRAIEITDTLWHGKPLATTPAYTARVGAITEPDGTVLDQAVATVYRAPHSFTGDDIVEIAVHGSCYVQRRLIALLSDAGCRVAAPGEFTRRAFMAGKLDLAQAEAVADVIASSSRAAHRIAISQLNGTFSRRLADLRQQLIDLAALLELELDFSEEDVEFASRTRLVTLATTLQTEIRRLLDSYNGGRAIKEGIPVAIVGPANVGKSSLLNRLLDDDRAIVSDIPGTTRDTVEETLHIGDYLFRFIDTAGIRTTDDPVEQLGITRSLHARARARILLSLSTTPSSSAPWREQSEGSPSSPLSSILPSSPTPPSSAPWPEQSEGSPTSTLTIHIINKTDLTPATPIPAGAIGISAKTGAGIDHLRTLLTDAARQLTASTDGESDIITNARHAQALSDAAESTARVIDGLTSGLAPDLVAQDLRQTIAHLGSITGAVTSTDILTTIFSRFCIGK